MDKESRRLEREAPARIADLTRALESNPEEARAFLKALLPGKLSWRPLETADGRPATCAVMMTKGRPSWRHVATRFLASQ